MKQNGVLLWLLILVPQVILITSFNNINPSGVVGGVTGVFIPYSDLESYDLAVVTGSASGDNRELLYSFIDSFADEYLSLANADKPSQITITRSATVPSDEIVRKTYTVVVNLDMGPTSVADE